MKFKYPQIDLMLPPFKGPPLPLSPLGGESHLGEATMLKLQSTVVAICVESRNRALKHIGTGFFVTPSGLVASAKHVLDECHKCWEQGGQPVAIHMDPDGSGWEFMPLQRPSACLTADVGITYPYFGYRNSAHKDRTILRLTEQKPAVGTRIYTCGYPLHRIKNVPNHGYRATFALASYGGEIQEFWPDGRKLGGEQIGPCYVTNIAIHPGNSGGPVFDKRGRVFGIVCSGFDVVGSDNESPISFVASICSILDLRLMQDTDSGPVECLLREIPSVRENLFTTDAADADA